MTSPNSSTAPAAPSLGRGIWRPLLRARFLGRAEPLFVDAGGLRSAASIWSGAQMWAQLLRTRTDGHAVVVRQADRLALLQLLVAVLWDGRALQLDAGAAAVGSSGWCLDGRQVHLDGQPVCVLHAGGWPDLAGPARLSALDMLTHLPADGTVAVGGRQVSHADLWVAHAAPLSAPASDPVSAPPLTQPTDGSATPAPVSAVLGPFDLASLATPSEVLGDALLPLLRHAEVWERTALPAG